MTDIIERAARAIIQQLGADGSIHEAGGKLSVDGVVPESLARAVLRAIREPDRQWSWAGVSAAGSETGDCVTEDGARAVWQAMIDAALGEE